ncbi:hypothetical protein OQA88_4725 [Cercophora sp. LCS_1]
MKVIILLAAIGYAVAQNLAGQPACATDCIISAISGSGCGADNLACQCGVSQAAIAASAAPCILRSCTVTGEVNQAQSAGLAACASYHATAYTTGNSTASTTSNGATAGQTGSATTGSSNGGSRTSATTRATASSTNAASGPIAKGAGVGGVIAFLGALLAL